MATLAVLANQIRYTIAVIEEEELAYISEAVQHNDNYDVAVYGFIYKKRFFDPRNPERDGSWLEPIVQDYNHDCMIVMGEHPCNAYGILAEFINEERVQEKNESYDLWKNGHHFIAVLV